jgi:hypothetical protein
MTVKVGGRVDAGVALHAPADRRTRAALAAAQLAQGDLRPASRDQAPA